MRTAGFSAASRAAGLLAGLCLTLPGLAQEASVFKWVDAQGVTHYSDQPPANSTAQEMTIKYRKPDRSNLQARAKAPADGRATPTADTAPPVDSDDPAEADRQKVLAERQASCQQARDRVAKYSAAQRLYKPGPNGERVYLSDEELDAERSDAKRAVDEYCS
jgi:hypothetical protein